VDAETGDPLQHGRRGRVDRNIRADAEWKRIGARGVDQHGAQPVAGSDRALGHDVALGNEHARIARWCRVGQLAIAQTHEVGDERVAGIVDRDAGRDAVHRAAWFRRCPVLARRSIQPRTGG
jgi:hypothetical protein